MFTLMFKSCFFSYFSNVEIAGNMHHCNFFFCFPSLITLAWIIWLSDVIRGRLLNNLASYFICEDNKVLPCSLQK